MTNQLMVIPSKPDITNIDVLFGYKFMPEIILWPTKVRTLEVKPGLFRDKVIVCDEWVYELRSMDTLEWE